MPLPSQEHRPPLGAGQQQPGDVWPLMGREVELAAIADAFESRKAVCWVLAGGPGVGKTRLAREALRRVEGRGFVTLWVVATRAFASIPLAAFAHLLPEIESGNSSLLELLVRA